MLTKKQIAHVENKIEQLKHYSGSSVDEIQNGVKYRREMLAGLLYSDMIDAHKYSNLISRLFDLEYALFSVNEVTNA